MITLSVIFFQLFIIVVSICFILILLIAFLCTYPILLSSTCFQITYSIIRNNTDIKKNIGLKDMKICNQICLFTDNFSKTLQDDFNFGTIWCSSFSQRIKFRFYERWDSNFNLIVFYLIWKFNSIFSKSNFFHHFPISII